MAMQLNKCGAQSLTQLYKQHGEAQKNLLLYTVLQMTCIELVFSEPGTRVKKGLYLDSNRLSRRVSSFLHKFSSRLVLYTLPG